MAIGWAMPRYIQRSRSGNIVWTVAYNTRSMIWDERQGEMWDGTRKLATLLHAEVMLPDGSDERFRNVADIVNAIDASEKRRDSVLGRDFILPLPRGVDLSTKLELARGFFNEYFVANGVPVILALHKAHLGKDGQKENDHAHGVVPQRYLEGDRFSAKKALVHEPEMLTGSKRFVAKAVNWSRAWREYQERHGIEVDPPALFPGKHLGPGHARNPTSEISKQHVMRQRLSERLTEVVMELSNGTNTISDDRFQAALAEMRDRHADEHETVHNGSGRSEEMPSQLRERHNREHQQLIDDRRNLSVAQWVQHYPNREATIEPKKLIELELADAAKQERSFQEWAKSLPEHLEPTLEDFQRTARLNDARRRAQKQEQNPALYDRYKAERGQSVASRKAAEQDVYDKFSSYNSQVRGFYAVQHQQQKLAVLRGTERHKEHEVLKAEQGRDRVEAHQLRAQQLAEARGSHPVLTWDAFLSREADRGDHEAARLLQQRQQREVQHGHER